LVKALAAENGPALKTYSEPLYTLCLALDRKNLLDHLLSPVLNAKEFTSDHFDQYAAYLQLLTRRKIALMDHPAIINAARNSLTGPNRFAAASLLARLPAERGNALPVLADSLKPGLPSEQQRAAISMIAESVADSTPKLLLKNWAAQSPGTRTAILETLMRREPWTFDLLQTVQPSEFDAARRNRLLKHESQRIRQLAESLFKSASSNRGKIVEQFRAALELPGDRVQGKAVFTKICATCHERDGVGNEVGPDLRTIVEHPPEKLLANILDPNADIQPGYHAYNCKLTNGEDIYGLISSESGNSVVFKLADGSKRNILRSEIQSLQSANLSLMPEGLEAGLTNQDMADLIAYLKAR
jgi:putative heme-binding domain-containing protein